MYSIEEDEHIERRLKEKFHSRNHCIIQWWYDLHIYTVDLHFTLMKKARLHVCHWKYCHWGLSCSLVMLARPLLPLKPVVFHSWRLCPVFL